MDNENNKVEVNNSTSSDNSLVKGSAWMTAGSIFSRILGAIYIIPWNAWLGGATVALAANALYAKGYNIYSEFLIISTAGIPSAISKQIAHYNALNEYAIGNRLFKQGIKLMALLGIIFAAIMFFGASMIATIFAGGDMATVPVIKSLSAAVLVIPILSITRGYFQGYGEMAPSAISQFVEQIARVFYMLLATYIIMKVQHGSYVDAVTQSTFAAFIGAVAAIAVLGYFFIRQLPRLRKLSRSSSNIVEVNDRKFIAEIVQQAVPFIVMGSGFVFYQMFDQATFNAMMNSLGHYPKSMLDQMYALFGFNANKLIMITISLASAMAVAVIPVLSKAHAQNDQKGIETQITKAFELFFFVMIPASIGMYGVSKPLWIVFYSYNEKGISMLQVSAMLAIILGLFTVLSAVLQGLYQNRTAINYLLVGLVVKVIVQWPMIAVFREFGPLLATFIGMLITVILMIRSLIKLYDVDLTSTIERVSYIIMYSLIMLVVIFVTNKILYSYLGIPNRRVYGFIILIIEAGIGGLIYTYLVLRNHLADDILGYQMNRFRKMLRIK
ncbi:transporter [Companilactobacillus sp. RD055328]|uniref:putative polysaccharide biosynthesis protein n=1 Tax=Companilactobacillus sp. RD055328 TaxID=2916634 RepID=UPI001FC8B9B3|nr:polysaccharide biosynthesis protein [Companilactobacillus sp. RD055328]GKQ42477.1 transporter [Companilactobacillus sp. RD055328]